jgi:hypothetical protein
MAETAFQTQYRQEFVAGFEDTQSRLRTACVTEAVVKGTTATFLVADSGSATATTRGVNGLIPARADDLTQTSATIAEWHDLVRKTNFNIFGSQGNQRQIMQMTSMGVVNRKIDDDIITQLDTATNDTGAYAQASLAMVVKAKVILGVNFVPTEEADNMFAVVTPAFMGYLHMVREFGSAEYVDVKPLVGPTRKFLRWMGVNWIEHPRLTGVDGASEKCYMFHRNAIGHAADVAGLEAPVGYDEEQAYSWCRVSIHMGSKLLQNGGVVQMKHDGSDFTAA